MLHQFLKKSKAYAALPAMPHIPQFSLEPLAPAAHAAGSEWWYIRDGNERVGLIQTWIKEIEMFRFFPAGDGKGEAYPIPEVYHWANLIGSRLQMYGTMLLPPLTSFTLSWIRNQGEALEFRVEHAHEGDIRGASHYRLSWDPSLGYVWQGDSRYTMPEPAEIEFSNLFAAGISESREDRKRWQKTIRMLADGRIAFVYHNPLNVPVDDIHAGGFVGFVAEEEANPFVEFNESSSPVSIITCTQWYDQHIVMKPPRTKEADGLYHARARYRFLSLPGPVARELEAAAVPDTTDRKPKGLGFLLNRTNDFEQLIPPDQVYNGGLWLHATRSDEQAHSGAYSLKVVGQGAGQETSAAPIACGPAVVGESKKRYRLSAWVKTDLADGAAYLRVDDVRWNWNDIQATRKSPELAGRRDWAPLAIEFQPGLHDPFLVVRLCVDGQGAAWFDDVLLENVGDTRG